MDITLKHTSDLQFVAQDETPVEVMLQGSAKDGAQRSALSPMQMVLAAVGGCTAMDVVAILKKQKQEYDSLTVNVHGERSNDIPKVFTRISIQFVFEGTVDPTKAMRAATLSAEKYCSVSHMLQASVDISHTVVVNGEKHEA